MSGEGAHDDAHEHGIHGLVSYTNPEYCLFFAALAWILVGTTLGKVHHFLRGCAAAPLRDPLVGLAGFIVLFGILRAVTLTIAQAQPELPEGVLHLIDFSALAALFAVHSFQSFMMWKVGAAVPASRQLRQIKIPGPGVNWSRNRDGDTGAQSDSDIETPSESTPNPKSSTQEPGSASASPAAQDLASKESGAKLEELRGRLAALNPWRALVVSNVFFFLANVTLSFAAHLAGEGREALVHNVIVIALLSVAVVMYWLYTYQLLDALQSVVHLNPSSKKKRNSIRSESRENITLFAMLITLLALMTVLRGVELEESVGMRLIEIILRFVELALALGPLRLLTRRITRTMESARSFSGDPKSPPPEHNSGSGSGSAV